MPVASTVEIMSSLELLADIAGYVLKRAVEEYIAESTWFPKISELVSLRLSEPNTRPKILSWSIRTRP
jgi:hypothetical protein